MEIEEGIRVYHNMILMKINIFQTDHIIITVVVIMIRTKEVKGIKL